MTEIIAIIPVKEKELKIKIYAFVLNYIEATENNFYNEKIL